MPRRSDASSLFLAKLPSASCSRLRSTSLNHNRDLYFEQQDIISNVSRTERRPEAPAILVVDLYAQNWRNYLFAAGTLDTYISAYCQIILRRRPRLVLNCKYAQQGHNK